ncbi:MULTISPECIES: urease accessory protein UreD [Chitinophagaceae]
MISKLDITVNKNGTKSYLKDVYVTQPFRVVPVGQHKFDDHAYLMIMSSSPGILSGDDYDIHILVNENAKLQLQSQSYQRLYNMEAKASQKMQVKMMRSSSFSYVPHPIVPHKNSTFSSVNKIEMEDECQLVLSEIITCGRKHHGEIFEFTQFHNLFEVYHNGKLILKDNILLLPQQNSVGTMGMLESYTHQGTLIYTATNNNHLDNTLLDSIHEMLDGEEQILGGISTLQQNGFIVRLLGYGGEQMFQLFQKIQDILWHIQN